MSDEATLSAGKSLEYLYRWILLVALYSCVVVCTNTGFGQLHLSQFVLLAEET